MDYYSVFKRKGFANKLMKAWMSLEDTRLKEISQS
jgi:hypothetical protein